MAATPAFAIGDTVTFRRGNLRTGVVLEIHEDDNEVIVGVEIRPGDLVRYSVRPRHIVTVKEA